ncbi:hypothetical protein Pan258_25360 [Symmachiella dynata]|nr:hypothetical protein Pan258_25360 [Symmachiella dynata]
MIPPYQCTAHELKKDLATENTEATEKVTGAAPIHSARKQ